VLVIMGKRLGLMALTMVVVSVLVFSLLELNVNGVATKVLGPYSSQDQREIWLKQNGYFDPLYQRYVRWLGHFVTGDLGQSVRFKAPVVEVLVPRLKNTAILGLGVFVVLIPVSLTLGILAGMREGAKLDRVISVASVITTSVREFASSVFLAAIFVFGLRWLPGTSTMIGGFTFKELLLPILVLVLYDFGYVARMTRASMAEVMATHYIRTAVLKG